MMTVYNSWLLHQKMLQSLLDECPLFCLFEKTEKDLFFMLVLLIWLLRYRCYFVASTLSNLRKPRRICPQIRRSSSFWWNKRHPWGGWPDLPSCRKTEEQQVIRKIWSGNKIWHFGRILSLNFSLRCFSLLFFFFFGLVAFWNYVLAPVSCLFLLVFFIHTQILVYIIQIG
jgi:hypothetical protein